MRIGIIGAGVVGGSLLKWLEYHTEAQIKVYDPGIGRTDTLENCHFCFIAVPVPTKSFKQDLSILEESITRCPKDAMIFVRSSVLPGTCDMLAEKYDQVICAMPEFLTERTAYEDTEKLDILIGFTDKYQKVPEQIFRMFPQKYIKVVQNKEAEMAKYIHNCFGALKVTYFNGVYDYCQKNNMDYENVLAGAKLTPFIGAYHTQVPGPDGKLGFGGKCFPKDLAAFMGLLGSHSLQALMRDVLLLNRYYRGEKEYPGLENEEV